MEKRSEKLLVFDVGNPECEGKLLDRDFLLSISHTLLPMHELAKTASARGIRCMTPGMFLESDALHGTPLLISALTNEKTQMLIAHGAAPFLLLCQESPFIASRFYLRFRWISKRFHHTMAFAGMRKQAHPRTKFHDMHFPIHVDSTHPSQIPFNERKQVVLVAGNKKSSSSKGLPISILYGARVKLLYPERMKLVTALAEAKCIDLYGKGWDTEARESVQDAYKGPLASDAKYRTLGLYKFAVCLENASFPGYVTEKIFDALLAGTVPIYLGDPLIEKSVPKDAFIDLRDFADHDSLISYITGMTEDRHQEYLAAGARFLSSPEFAAHTHEMFVQTVLTFIDEYEA